MTIVAELRKVWPLLRGCRHDFDPECARCRWLQPLADALRNEDVDAREREYGAEVMEEYRRNV